MTKKIVVLPGDGVGPEIMEPTLEILRRVADLKLETHLFGGVAIDKYQTPLTDETLTACKRAGAVLLGAVGGSKWESFSSKVATPEKGLLQLRKELELYANLRPVKSYPALYESSPLKQKNIEGVDLLLVRELTGGIYFGEKNLNDSEASDVCSYTKEEIERIAKVAFRLARRKVTSVDKANVLATSKLWRKTVSKMGQEHNIKLDHLLVDNAAMALINRAREFDVILTENMFGDILSDEAAMLTGSIGMLPSASLGEEGKPGLFEPIHGSAPDIAGKGVANPLGMILSAALMLRYGLDMPKEAKVVETAVEKVIEGGLRTRDLGGSVTTKEMAAAVLAEIK